MRTGEDVPPDLFLSAYPPQIRVAANRLRRLVKGAVPDTVERVRTGWRLIGFEVPAGRRTRYFACVAPEVEHVHLGFEYGAWMADPRGLLEGAHLQLRRVRYLTFRPGEPIRAPDVTALVLEAARVAVMPATERMSLELEKGWHAGAAPDA
jgi:hypothetical protein